MKIFALNLIITPLDNIIDVLYPMQLDYLIRKSSFHLYFCLRKSPVFNNMEKIMDQGGNVA